MTTHLVWFRQDLRLHDNLALAAAIRLHACWRCISLHHASGRRITCRRVRLNLSMLN
jgi:deoxyribodipyrimidine photo-lyase